MCIVWELESILYKWVESFVTQFDISQKKSMVWICALFSYLFFFYQWLFLLLFFLRNKNHMDWNCNVASLVSVLNVINDTFHKYWIRSIYLFIWSKNHTILLVLLCINAIISICKKNCQNRSESHKNQMCMKSAMLASSLFFE